jgi:hypothetical protein
MLSGHFSFCATTVKEILARDLGLKQFARRRVPQTLSGTQTVARVKTSTELLQILNDP